MTSERGRKERERGMQQWLTFAVVGAVLNHSLHITVLMTGAACPA